MAHILNSVRRQIQKAQDPPRILIAARLQRPAFRISGNVRPFQRDLGLGIGAAKFLCQVLSKPPTAALHFLRQIPRHPQLRSTFPGNRIVLYAAIDGDEPGIGTVVVPPKQIPAHQFIGIPALLIDILAGMSALQPIDSHRDGNVAVRLHRTGQTGVKLKLCSPCAADQHRSFFF